MRLTLGSTIPSEYAPMRKATIEIDHDELNVYELLDEFSGLLAAYGYAKYKFVVEEG